MAASSSSSSPYTCSYLPSYTTLWSHPPPPALARPSSPPRRAGASNASAYDARTQVYLAELQHASQARAGWYHASGVHLPCRTRSSTMSSEAATQAARSGTLIGQQPLLCDRNSTSATTLQGRGRNRWRDRWRKEDMRMREAAERGWHWTGSGVSQEEEKDLNEEEAERANYREALLAYGRDGIVVLGRGRTMHEDQLDAEERGEAGMNAATSSDDPGGNITEGGQTVDEPAVGGSGGGAWPIRRGRRGRETGRGQTAAGADDDAAFDGEYTLDNGGVAGVEGVIEDESAMADSSVAGGGGGGRVRTMRRDMDADIESMD